MKQAALFLGLALAAVPAAAADPIVIGQSAPLSGANADFGKDIRNGALAYFRKVNDAGGVHGRRIELESIDDMNQRKVAGANAAQLVNERNVVALFGFASATLSMDAMPVVRDKRVPFFAPFTGADAIHRQNPYVFVLRASYENELTRILDHWRGLGADRVTVLHYDDEIGNQNFATVERLMKGAGKRAVGVKFERNGDVKRAQIDAIIKSDPHVVVTTILYQPTAKVLQMLREANRPFNMTALSFTGPSQLAKVGADAAAGVSVAGVVPPPGKTLVPVVKECRDAQAKAGLGELTYTSLEACIAAKVLVEGLRRTGPNPTREGLYRALTTITALDVGGYTVSFGPERRHGSHFVELAVISRGGRLRF